jgi:hypothetical protein
VVSLRDIERSLAALDSNVRATWSEAEPVMTDGYARVLALEAERLRVMRELVGLAASTSTADRAAALTSELDGIGIELSRLRSALNAVRRRFARSKPRRDELDLQVQGSTPTRPR